MKDKGKQCLLIKKKADKQKKHHALWRDAPCDV